MCHPPSGVLDQIAQDRERLGPQQDVLVVSIFPLAPQTLIGSVQPERRNSFMMAVRASFTFDLL